MALPYLAGLTDSGAWGVSSRAAFARASAHWHGYLNLLCVTLGLQGSVRVVNVAEPSAAPLPLFGGVYRV